LPAVTLLVSALGLVLLTLARTQRVRTPSAKDLMRHAQRAMAQGRTDEALETLSRIPDKHRLAPQARLAGGQLELRRHRLRAAESLLRKASTLDPRLVQARRELIYIYGVQLRRAELGRTFQELARLVSLRYDDIFIWCLTRGVQWDAAEQVETLSRCLEADPEDRETRLALAENLQLTGRLDDGLRTLGPLPDADAAARAARARILIDRGDLEAAKRLLASGPEDDAALARLRGRQALRRHDANEAIRQFRVADALEPNHRDTLFGLALALQMAGWREESLTYAQRVRDHDLASRLLEGSLTPEGRTDPRLFVRLGEAYARIGRLPEARAWLDLAIQRDPLDADAQKALHQIGGRSR
jgi:tetratricopeptide (TPR) repeat protein